MARKQIYRIFLLLSLILLISKITEATPKPTEFSSFIHKIEIIAYPNASLNTPPYPENYRIKLTSNLATEDDVGAWVAAGWIARAIWPFVKNYVAPYAFGKALDWVIDRSGLIEMGNAGIYELRKHCNSSALSRRDCRIMRNAAAEIQNIMAVLEDPNLSDKEAREKLKKHFRNLDRLDYYEDQLSQIDKKLFELELRQRQMGLKVEKNRRMIADNEGRILELQDLLVNHKQQIVSLEGRIIEAEGRLDRLDERVDDIEIILNRERGRYDKHLLYLGGSFVYANPKNLAISPTLGGKFDLQYNVNQFFSIFTTITGTYYRVPSEDIYLNDERKYNYDFIWDNYAGFLGGSFGIIPPKKTLSLALGGGIGISMHRLVAVPESSTLYDRSRYDEVTMNTNVAFMAQLDVGLSPHLYSIEPYMSIGITKMLNDISYQSENINSNLGSDFWQLTLGVRYRFTPDLSHFVN